MPKPMRSKAVVQVTGIIYCLAGLALASAGGWLAALGGSYFYAVAGVGVLITGGLLLAMRRSALWVFAAVLIGTLLWAVYEVGLDWWPLAARGDIIFPMALWLLTPWVTRRILNQDAGSYATTTLPLWLGVVAGGIVLVAALLTDYGDISGAIASFDSGQEKLYADGQPDEDWRAYGRSQFGHRFSPLKQITPDNVKQLAVAWTFRTGDGQGPNDSLETTFEVTPIKVRIPFIYARSISGSSRLTPRVDSCAGPLTRRCVPTGRSNI